MSTLDIACQWTRGGFRLDVDLRLPMRGVTALFGASGSGKTTLLRLVAGLDRAPARVVVDGDLWQDARSWRAPHRRPVGVVFQEANLFPHLTARANIDFGRRRCTTAMADADLAQLIELLGLENRLQHKPAELSGGERQRVAIARALALKPKVLLMDEPLAALDAARRADILPYLERLHTELAIPMLYVTHSTDEVARLADHLVVLENGGVTWQGDAATGLAANGVRHLRARVMTAEDDGCRIEIDGQTVLMPGLQAAPGDTFTLTLTRVAQSSENR